MSNEHREQAREILLDCEQCTGMYLGSCSEPNDLVDRIASALSSRDAEAGKVLEGLALRRNIKQGGHCWCYKDLTNDAKPHSDNCSAARDLYSKLQAAEKGEQDSHFV